MIPAIAPEERDDSGEDRLPVTRVVEEGRMDRVEVRELLVDGGEREEVSEMEWSELGGEEGGERTRPKRGEEDQRVRR